MFEALKQEWAVLVADFNSMVSGVSGTGVAGSKVEIPSLSQLHQDAVTLMGKTHNAMGFMEADLAETKAKLLFLEQRIFGANTPVIMPTGTAPVAVVEPAQAAAIASTAAPAPQPAPVPTDRAGMITYLVSRGAQADTLAKLSDAEVVAAFNSRQAQP